MKTVYWTEKNSEGRPWYKGSDRYWVVFSSDVNKEFVSCKDLGNYKVYLSRRTYTFGLQTFYEYSFEYYIYSQTGFVPINRQYIKNLINYNKEFEDLLT